VPKEQQVPVKNEQKAKASKNNKTGIDTFQYSDNEADLISYIIGEYEILIHLPFVFEELRTRFPNLDNHNPFYYNPSVVVASKYKGFLFINMDGFYSNCLDPNEIKPLFSWSNVVDIEFSEAKKGKNAKIDIHGKDGILTIEDGGDGNSLTIIDSIWCHIMKRIANEFRNEPIINWTYVKDKMGIRLVSFNSYKELTDWLKTDIEATL
jgi:hypothetical protein